MLHKQECYRRAREEGNRQRSEGWRDEGLNDGDACQKSRFKTLKEKKPGTDQDLIDP